MKLPNLSSGLVGHAAQYGLPAAFALKGFRDRTKSGQNPAFSAIMETASFAGQVLLSGPAQFALYFGVPMVRAAASAVVGQAREQNTMMRMARTPFSHRFEHSDVSARAQALGLQAIGSAWGHSRMGSEAAQMARRYGRSG